MVCDDSDLVCGTHKEVAPVFQSSHDCEEFPVPDRVIAFCLVERLGVVSDWASAALRVVLP